MGSESHAWRFVFASTRVVTFEEYLKPLGLGQVEAACRLDVSLNRLRISGELPGESDSEQAGDRAREGPRRH